MTAKEWQERLAALPHKETQRLLKGERGESADAKLKPLKLTRALAPLSSQLTSSKTTGSTLDLPPATAELPPAPENLPPPTANPSPPTVDNQVATLKEKLKEQRALLKEKDARLAELSVRLAQLEKERDGALAERDTERQTREALEARLERERRRKAPEPTALVVTPPTSRTVTASPSTDFRSTELPDALARLLTRGHDATVLALCRELLTDESLSVALRAGVQGVYATALDSLGAPDAPEQCRAAAEAFLSATQPLEAVGYVMLSLTKGALTVQEKALLQRLLALAERHGELERVGKLLARQRLTHPTAVAALSKALEALGKKYAGLLPAASTTKLTPDMPVALPTTSQRAASVTARRLVQAVDEGDGALVGSARAGLTELRASNPTLAEALLDTVGALSAPALAVLTAPRLRPAVVDASNAARHIADPLAAFMNEKKKPTASLAQLLQLREFLLRHGFFPVHCIADANLHHLVSDKAQYAALVEKQIVRETLPGTSADELMLAEARAHQAPLITNDRLADWGKQAQNIERLGFTVHKGHVTLLPF